MIYLLQTNSIAWHEIGSNIATILGLVGIIVLIVDHFNNRNTRNIQLMHRCIDNYRKWSDENNGQYNYFYLELLNEELFYFQNNLIEKKVALEWIEGIIDYVQFYSIDGTIINHYNKQQNLEALSIWQNKIGYYERIRFFVNTSLSKTFKIPDFSDPKHVQKKRTLAIELYKHIKRYKY